jgi:hypothetical protein
MLLSILGGVVFCFEPIFFVGFHERWQTLHRQPGHHPRKLAAS